MKKLIIIAITIPCIAFSQTDKTFKQALKTNDAQKKIELLSQVISSDPKNLDAYFYRAIAKNNAGDYYGAIVDYSKIIVEKPDADTYFNRGNSKYSLNNIAGAILDYSNAVKLNPNFADAYFSLSCSYFDLGDYDNALKNLNKTLEITPYYIQAYNLRSNIFVIQNKIPEAINDLSLAIIFDQGSETYFNRGVAYLNNKNYSKAKSDFNNSLKYNYNNSFAYFYRGVAYLLLNKHKKASFDFKGALRFDDSDFDAMLGLAIAYYKLERFEESKSFFIKAKTILSNPDSNIDNENIELFENSYWYQNHLAFFNDALKDIEKL